MFTGIIEAVGNLIALERQREGARARIGSGKLDLSDARIGESIAVNGVCLTVVDLSPESFFADLSGETLSRTTFSALAVGAMLNLERSLTLTTRLGGHLVSGHVDGTGAVLACDDADHSRHLHIRAPDTLAKYIAEKGSICVDGVSLTVNGVRGAEFDLTLVPHTLQETTLGSISVGHVVNLEVDIIARYLERLLLGARAPGEGRPAGGFREA